MTLSSPLLKTVRTLSIVLLLSTASLSRAAYADSEIPHRVLVGLNLFPNILSVTKGGRMEVTPSEEYSLWVVYHKREQRARELAEKLRKMTRQINRREVQVEVISVTELGSAGYGTGLFLSESLGEAWLDKMVERTAQSGEVLFSPFSGDVEGGVMVGLDVRSKIRPYLNLKSIAEAGLNCNPVLIRMSRIRD